jgi:hypothetical protein
MKLAPVTPVGPPLKLVERVVVKQLTFHLESENLMVPVQSAYRKNHSTETALLKIVNYLLLSVDGKLDQSAAFDTVDHSILIDRLAARFSVSGLALNWVRSYLENRSQSVCVFGVSSPHPPISLRYGVPQGSVLGPIMFTLYNSPLHDIATLLDIIGHYYADDTQYVKSFKLTEDGEHQRLAYASLSNCIGGFILWMTENRLKGNDEKTDALVVHSGAGKCKPLDLPLIAGTVAITPSQSVKNLGVFLDPQLTMNDQIKSVYRKSYFHISRIARIRKYLS